MKKILIIAGVIIALTACGKKDKPSEAEMNKLGSALTKLSSAVEATVRYKKPPEGISDMELLKLATKHDPNLLTPFADYTVKVSRENRHGIVLVCTKDGSRGLLEDAGCSTEMDKQLWKSRASCKFSLTADAVCGR